MDIRDPESDTSGRAKSASGGSGRTRKRAKPVDPTAAAEVQMQTSKSSRAGWYFEKIRGL